MDKEKALEKLKELKTNFNEEVAKLEKIINQPETLFEKVTTYEAVCKYLKEKQLTLKDYSFIATTKGRKRALAFGKFEQIQRLFNGDWETKFDGKQENWYPYFAIGSGGVLGFCDSDYTYCCRGRIGYFKDQETSNFVGKTFIDIYREIY